MRRLLVLTSLLLVATVTPAAADLLVPTLTVEPVSTTATVGSSITVAGAITDPADTPGLSVVVSRSTDGSTWTDVTGSPGTTADDGSFGVSDTPPDPGTYTYRASWVGDATTYGAGEALSTQQLTVLPTSTLTVEPASPTSFVGEAVNIEGAITDPAGIEGASVVITRSSDGSTYNEIANSPTTTDVTGEFTVSDSPPLGTYTYRASWDGDGATFGSGAAISTTLTVSKWSVSLSLNASDPSIVYGDAVKLSGLWSSDSGVLPTDTTVTITRTKSGGSTVERTTTLTASNAYKLRDTPPSAGTFTYSASWAGDDTHEAQTSASVAVAVTKRSTALRLDVTHARITYGDATRLVATLKRGDAGSKVRFEKRSGTNWTGIGTVQVASDGTARLKVSPSARHAYRVVFDGTGGLKASTSDTATVEVRPIMISRMIGTFMRVGTYAVYKCCTAYFYVKLKPIHPRLSWTATVQYYGNGKWRPLGSGSYRFDADGGSGIYLNASAGYRYRVRGHFDGDGDHLPATSAWNYFKFK